MEPKIKIQDYSYILPEKKIAKYPLAKRDDSKILVFEKNKISESKFSNLAGLLPSGSLMVFNNTKVVPARLLFRKETGALIEIFCLEPVLPQEYALSFASVGECVWNAVIGNAKRWKEGELKFLCGTSPVAAGLDLRAALVNKGENNGSVVRFTWKGGICFSEVLDICGKIPIPPYLKRDTEALDRLRYQTLYAKIQGSVAAPTAGLHFTEKVLREIDEAGIKRDQICLHVGAGTFVPVKSEYIADHKMHTEPFSVSRAFLQDLADLPAGRKIIAVGTTSTRCLESLYFLGVQCMEKGRPGTVSQWEPYAKEYDYTFKEAVSALIDYMDKNGMDVLTARTGIIIVPSYKFRAVDLLITNFHQPRSTLLLLISAFIGEKWRDVYDYALEHDFRFLSYGDSSLLVRPEKDD